MFNLNALWNADYSICRCNCIQLENDQENGRDDDRPLLCFCNFVTRFYLQMVDLPSLIIQLSREMQLKIRTLYTTSNFL